MSAQDLIERLSVERQPDGSFAARHVTLRADRLFGGQMTAQALSAAARTVGPDKSTVSLHVTFIEPGERHAEVRYLVESLREGRTDFRQVDIVQGRRCARAMATFGTDDTTSAIDHQMTAPPSLHPEDLPPFERMNGRSVLVRCAPEHAPFRLDSAPAEFELWFRADVPLPDEWRAHHVLLAYLSDLTMTASPFRPVDGVYSGSDEVISATRSIHVWFHRPFRADDWLMLSHRCPSAAAGRALIHGHWFDVAGRLVASITQETLSVLR